MLVFSDKWRLENILIIILGKMEKNNAVIKIIDKHMYRE